MMSYAVDGGSVGPHIDAYDVFLLQVEGRRHWSINHSRDYSDDALIENIELRILQEFTADEAWTLDPGDMLYLPPNVAHHGVALDDCITCSIGFRSPSVHALVSEYAESLAASLPGNLRYKDPQLKRQDNPGEITQQALSGIKQLLIEHLKIDDHFIRNWFGEFMTAPGSTPAPDHEAFQNQHVCGLDSLKHGGKIHHSPTAKFLFTRDDHGEDDRALLFVDGKSYTSSLLFAQTLCRSHTIGSDELLRSACSDGDKDILLELFANELLYGVE